MSSQVSNEQLGDAILQSVEHGSFTQDEQIASAPVSAKALPGLIATIDKAREDTKNEIRKISREAASDVDGWITQARKLQDDIKRSQDTAKEIVQQAEASREHAARVQDSASKLSFLHSEVAYNETLTQVVEQLRDISTLLGSAQDAVVHGHIMHAIERLEDVDGAFKQLGPYQSTRVFGVLKNKEAQMKKDVVKIVTESWNNLIQVDASNHKISLKKSIEQATVQIQDVIDQATKLGLLDGFLAQFARDFDQVISSHRLASGIDKVIPAFEINGDDIRLTGIVNDRSVKATLEDMQSIAEYLSSRLPPSTAAPLSAKLVPAIASQFISNLLQPAVPTTTTGVLEFQETLSYVLGYVEYLDELGWSGQERLTEWVDKSAETWLAKQKEAAIAKLQQLLPTLVQEKRVVERVETQVVSKGDALHTNHEDHEDDWGEEWGEDLAPKETEKEETVHEEVEEEDMSAWGIDDDSMDETTPGNASEEKKLVDDEAEDWGDEWGDDDAVSAQAPEKQTKSPKSPKQHKQAVNTASQNPAAEQEVTLRETYTVTAIPDSMIEIIQQVVTDVETLNSPELFKSAIAPASGGLFAIPSLLLAMYRATAAMHYSKDIAGNMLMYNDCQRLSDRLRMLLKDQTEKDQKSHLPRLLRPSFRLHPKLETDIKSIDGFGKRAYGREMESQRQIIRDHLEDAQGFQGCTNVPFATVCDDAVATTIDRISDVKRQWQTVLSHSTLLQSLGSLVSTALTKFINDVTDMSDIAEDESKKLHGYCISFATLAQHFQTQDDSGEITDMAIMYTPNWFKFQYLTEILDSNLADIKYFWTDGELKLEMEAEELVGLIEALFAPSDHRRRAIAEIRRTSMQ